MNTSESAPPPVCVAFVWHMHQPYYRSATTGDFQMPWARLHAVKDYLDMVEILAGYPTIHQTFNLVPSLVEQLEDYAAGGLPETWSARVSTAGTQPVSGAAGSADLQAGASLGDGAGLNSAAPSPETLGTPPVTDVYWQHTIKPAADLTPSERAFVLERMCELPDHPRARSHPRYLELANKRQAEACKGWAACSAAFTVDDLRDLQVWFDLAWCDPTLLETEPLLGLVQRGRDFREEDKQALARVQNDVLRRVIPAYRKAADCGQIEISTSPYYHPILPLVANTDSARVGCGDTILPHRRFAHPEDAWEHVHTGMTKHEQVFGTRPRGMWCSEQSVGEDVLPLLTKADLQWTISDQTVLSRSATGSAAAPNGAAETPSPYQPYLLGREEGDVAIVFRDHTLSDLIGFGYQSWDSRDAANDLLNRIRAIGAGECGAAGAPPLITIALDGENAWEYYPHDGRDFLHFLYEGLAADPGLRCVTLSEYLQEFPATTPLDWLHTGSWIGGDLRTWSGDPGHNAAWDLLHDARDLAAARRSAAGEPRLAARPRPVEAPSPAAQPSPAERPSPAAEAWRHIMVAEGSDWFWWFGEHHHTGLDHVWDLEFRQHLQEVYRLLGEPVPLRLYLPVFAVAAEAAPILPTGVIHPVIDGRISADDGWERAGILPPDHPSTMQRTEGARVVEARFGWGPEHLFMLIIPRDTSDLDGLEIDITVTPAAPQEESIFHMTLTEGGRIDVACTCPSHLRDAATGAWLDVVEIALPLNATDFAPDPRVALALRVGRGGMTDHVFRSTGLAPVREA
jgi:alpha-amylase/alpha-mannosidase (GH57 family)